MPSGYRNGADLERAVKHHLEDNGYLLVIKSGGSKGKVDVIGLKRGETVIVQCKRSGTAVRPADRVRPPQPGPRQSARYRYSPPGSRKATRPAPSGTRNWSAA